MPLPVAPAARHRAVAGEFSRLVDGTRDWSAPTPVAGWSARDVVDHLVTWFPAFLSSGGIDLAAGTGPSTADDPAAAWRHHAEAVQALVEHRGAEGFTHPVLGTQPLARAVDRFYTSDVFMHSWDLARASRQDARLDEDVAAELLGGMVAMEDALRGSGHYGPAVPGAAEAPVVDRLMGFIGRDPAWRPTS
jgi:uncharacterized protein (TIGR03086 family)